MKIKGFFNESCNICNTEINHYKKINKTIDWINVINNKNAYIETKLTPKKLIRRIHIIKNNKLYKGLDAFIIIWNEIPRYRFLAKFTSIPIIYQISWLIYEFIALILFYKNSYILKQIDEQ